MLWFKSLYHAITGVDGMDNCFFKIENNVLVVLGQGGKSAKTRFSETRKPVNSKRYTILFWPYSR